MTETRQILSAFSPISLDEMGNVKLMDRRDTKFIFPKELLPGFLTRLRYQYHVLEVNGVRTPRYQTVYYDTDCFFHFQQHHTKRLNRYKVRTRKYLESNESFLEIKFKNNHGRTIKNRIAVDHDGEMICEKGRGFLARKATIDAASLEPKLWIRFSRITLVNKECAERVTLDLGLHYTGNETQKSFDRLIIAEVKQGCKARSPFILMMREMKVRPFSVSKYCLGIASLYSGVRHNLVKPKIRHLNRFLYDPHRNR